MIKAIVSGHVHGLPEIRHDKNNHPFSLVKVWLPLTPQSKCQLFVSIIAFADGPYHEIIALKTDDAVSIVGEMKISIWKKSPDEKAYPSLEMVAHRVLSMPSVFTTNNF